jgi:hypothetical protein
MQIDDRGGPLVNGRKAICSASDESLQGASNVIAESDKHSENK